MNLSRHSLYVLLGLVPFGTAPALAQNPATTVTIDVAANRKPIDPRVYGVAATEPAQLTALSDLNVPLNRIGGNNSSRYNWQINASNHDFDFYFESIDEGGATPSGFVDGVFSATKGVGAQTMLTIPMVGWVAKLGPNREKLASFSIAKYGPQCDNDAMYFPDAGNGVIAPNCNTFVVNNDANDANVPADSNFQKGWVQYLVGKWGTAASGGIKYYILDNEHSIWFSTHRDAHPEGPHATEIRDKMIDYATMIKSVDSGATVIGPEEFGWTGYIFSGYDQQWSAVNGYVNIPDRTLVMGGMDYMPWLLGQLKQSADLTGVKPIDVFSLHYYPQENEFTPNNDIDNATQLRRNRSTRSLWDPAYVDTSYIMDIVQLIPRMRNWVNTNYFPGTPIAITEYNWGAENHINGATTQADIFGIFGREGLDMAARWTTPDAATPTYKAMKMYRNYDGVKSTFGDTSVKALVLNSDNLSAFAAQRASDNALTVMVISKVLTGSTPVTLSLSNFAGTGTAQMYQLTSANVILRLADAAYAGNTLTATVPPQSITLFVLPPAGAAFAVVNALSRKFHAGVEYDLVLDRNPTINGTITVEPRFVGTGHKIAFRFNAPVTSFGSVTVLDSGGATVTRDVFRSGNEIIVSLSNLGDNKRVTLSATNVNAVGVNVSVSVGFLVGDMNSSKAINASDINAVKAHLNQGVNINTAKFNVSLSGTISAADVSAVKVRSGTVLK